MRTNNLYAAAWCLVAAVVLTGCATDPEQAIVGKWKADDSASGMAMRAAKLKQESPDAETSVVMGAARSMGHVGLEVRADKTFDLHTGGKALKGSWTFDKASGELQLDAKTAEFPPENADPNAEPFKPTSFIALWRSDTNTLRLLPIPRESYDLIKDSADQ